MKLKNLTLAVLLLGVATGAVATEEDPGCPPQDDLTTEQSEKVFAALSSGKTVIRCEAGRCWDMQTGETMQYQRTNGGLAPDGIFFIDMYPVDQTL